MLAAKHSSKISEKKLKKKTKAKARKDRRKERLIREKANTALEKNLVINLSDVDVPLYSIAILAYGPGWIPRPTFQDTQFKVDGYNAANKQCWKALYKDSERTNDVPMSLLKKPITSMCTNVKDPAIRSVRESIISFVDNFKPKKTAIKHEPL